MIVTIDFETFYSKEYSLSRMSEVDYILNPLFQPIMCSIQQGDANQPVHVYLGPDMVEQALAEIDWKNVALLSHNVRFDGAILAWVYNHIPRMYLDTLSMARAMTHAYNGSSSLAAIAKHMGLPAKGDAVTRALGRRFEDFSRDELLEYAQYCQHDNALCRTIFDRFRAAGFPTEELRLIDLMVRMFVQPQAQLNQCKLAEHLHAVQAEQRAALDQLRVFDKASFSSNLRFAELLESYGVEVPMKRSSATGKLIPALSLNDWEFKELRMDPTQPPFVQSLLACRVNAKSTIEESRAKTLLNLAKREVGCPTPYKYFGAHTGRFSGDGGFNFANLKRGSPIRHAIEAPEGMRIVHRDSSQIEARMVAWLAGCDELTQAFAEGRDVYSEFASRFYRRPIAKENKRERFTGKTAVLSLGYQAGAKRFRHALFIGQGGVSVELTLEGAAELVDFYRDAYWQIPELWRACARTLVEMTHTLDNDAFPATISPVLNLTCTNSTIELPNKMLLRYPRLRYEMNDEDGAELVYDGPFKNKTTKRIYGGKLTENLCQALARIVLTDVMLLVHQTTGKHPVLSTYDSLDYCVPQSEAAAFDKLLEEAFARRPAWAPDLPLASEGGWGKSVLLAEQMANA